MPAQTLLGQGVMTEETRSAGESAGGGPLRGWRAAFPPAQWLAGYQPQWDAQDAVAGVTLAAYGIPLSLAYASLAGLPAPRYQPRPVGVRSCRALLLGEKLLPGLPVALIVVVISIIVLSVTPLGDLGFNVVGALPQGLPDFHVPGLRVRPCYYELA